MINKEQDKISLELLIFVSNLELHSKNIVLFFITCVDKNTENVIKHLGLDIQEDFLTKEKK